MKKYKWLIITIVAAMVIGACSGEGTDDNGNSETIVTTEVSEDISVVSSTIQENTSTKSYTQDMTTVSTTTKSKNSTTIKLKDIPSYTGSPYVIVNDNEPFFTDSEITTTSFETYAELDSYKRCGVVMACIGKDIMPTEDRGSIGHIKPSGWHTVKYDIVDGKYLYNRCHLIGFQLTGENDNQRNLITGTRYFNVDGMLPFEDMVADYVKETDNHVMYRVTPFYKGINLVAQGVLMEGYSVEDQGAGICFNVFCYNVQPGIEIDYSTGDSVLLENEKVEETTKKVKETSKTSSSSNEIDYILNLSSHKFHYPDCFSVDQMNESNKGYYTGSRNELISQGYDPCGNCNP